MIKQSRVKFEDFLELEKNKILNTNSTGKLLSLKESYKAKLGRITAELEDGSTLKQGRKLFLRGKRKFLIKLLTLVKERRKSLNAQ
jgi:hypothetical protein